MKRLTSTALAIALVAASAGAQRLREVQPDPLDAGRELHVYDIRDLVTAIAGAQADDAEPDEAKRRAARDRVATAIRRTVASFLEPGLTDGEDIKVLASQVIVARARPEQQAWIANWLRLQRERPIYMLSLESRITRLPPAALATLGLGDKPKILTDGDATAAFVAKLEACKDVDTLFAPRVLTLALQRATISCLDKISYVADFAIEVVEPGKREIADPIVKTVVDGVVFDGFGCRLANGRIGLSGTVDVSEVRRPIATRKIEIRPGTEPVEIALPEVKTARIDTTCVVPDGGTVVFPGPLFEGKHVLIMLTARAVFGDGTPIEKGPGKR